jgi:hypothetical protein
VSGGTLGRRLSVKQEKKHPALVNGLSLLHHKYKNKDVPVNAMKAYGVVEV